MPTPEKAAYNKEYYQKNKEKISAQQKEYLQENKEKIAAQKREYRQKNKEKNKEKLAAYEKEYSQTPQGKRRTTISSWKHYGLIHNDYNQLYDAYLESTNCEKCDIEYGQYGDGTHTYRCMDHCHDYGYFRNFLCCKCNIERG
mgnify:CR=1 FL=1